MPSIGRDRPGAQSRETAVFAVFAANAVPIVGVLALDWNGAVLLVLYWFELWVDSFWALVRALFAGRPPGIAPGTLLLGPLVARQPTLSIPWTGLRIHLVTLLVLPVVAGLLFVVWLLAGAVLVGPFGPNPFTQGAWTSVMAGTVGIFVLTGATTLRNYFYAGTYRDHNFRTAIAGHLYRLGAVFVAGLLTVSFIAAATTEGTATELGALDPTAVGVPLLVVVVCLKCGSELLGVYSDRLTAYFKTFDPDYGWLAPPPAADAVDATPPDDCQRVRPTRWGRLLGGPVWLPRHPGVALLGGLGLLVAGLFALGGAWRTVAGVVAASVAVPLVLASLDHLLRYGAVEYHIAPGKRSLVASDRLFGVVLWRVESVTTSQVRIEQTPLDAVLGTDTVVIEHTDEAYVLPHLPTTEPILTACGRRSG